MLVPKARATGGAQSQSGDGADLPWGNGRHSKDGGGLTLDMA